MRVRQVLWFPLGDLRFFSFSCGLGLLAAPGVCGAPVPIRFLSPG